MYNILVSLRARLSGPDLRHIWFQEPMRFEDAYGRVLPTPVEYDYPMMGGALRGKFRRGRGKILVDRDQWELFDPANAHHIFTPTNWGPIPGMRITMAMIIPQKDDQMLCPRLGCTSNVNRDGFGGR